MPGFDWFSREPAPKLLVEARYMSTASLWDIFVLIDKILLNKYVRMFTDTTWVIAESSNLGSFYKTNMKRLSWRVGYHDIHVYKIYRRIEARD